VSHHPLVTVHDKPDRQVSPRDVPGPVVKLVAATGGSGERHNCSAIIGAYLLEVIAPKGIGLGVGTFLILFAIYSLINPSRTLPEKDYILITGGLLSGFTAGLIGLGGAIRGAFLISTKIRKETYVATSAAIALCTDIARCTTYVVRGSLESQYFWYIPVLIMVAFAGTRLGVRLLKRFPELIVKRVVLVALVLASISFILNYLGIINMG